MIIHRIQQVSVPRPPQLAPEAVNGQYIYFPTWPPGTGTASVGDQSMEGSAVNMNDDALPGIRANNLWSATPVGTTAARLQKDRPMDV
jgi:hypothetical protein